MLAVCLSQEPANQHRAADSLLLLGQDILVNHVARHLQLLVSADSLPACWAAVMLHSSASHSPACLQDLQRLRNSGCKQLRGWVDSAPDAAWRTAALNTVAPFHPMLCCPDVRAYLAWQAEGDAAFAQGCSWPPRYQRHSSIARRATPKSVFWVRNHDGSCLAVLRGGSRLELTQLPSASTTSFPLPAGYEGRVFSFSSDSSMLALLMCESTGPQEVVPGIMTVSTAEAAVHTIQVPEARCQGSSRTALTMQPPLLEWAPTANRLLLSAGSGSREEGYRSDFWVFDGELALIARLPGSWRWARPCWNASSSGLLFPEGSHFPGDACRWWVLPELPGGSGVLSEPLPGVRDMRWGSFLPGVGEVVLGVADSLACWAPCMESRGWVQLGALLPATPHNCHLKKWVSALRRLAVATIEGLQIFWLEPGPELQLVHDLKHTQLEVPDFPMATAMCLSMFSDGHLVRVAFSPDSRYVLHSCQAACGYPVVVHVITGAIQVCHSHLLEGVRDRQSCEASWVPSGIHMQVPKLGSALYHFPCTALERPRLCWPRT